MLLLAAIVVAVVLSAAATALAASPSYNTNSAEGNSGKNKDFAGLIDIGTGTCPDWDFTIRSSV